jgi:hypothetical protein
MADEFKSMIKGFSSLGTNYCANARKVTSDLEARKILDIYETGLSGAMNGIGQMLTAQYDGLPEATRKEVDNFITVTGALPMLDLANKTIGPGSLQTAVAVGAAVELFPKIKQLIRSAINIEPGGWVDKGLNWIDTIVENIPKLLQVVGR